MATPTSLPASFSTGAVLTAAQMNDLRGAFRILQVVTGTTTTEVLNNTTTYVDTNLTASITPSATASKILVMVNQFFYHDTANGNMGIRLVRGSTTIQQLTDPVFSSAGAITGALSIVYLDSPSSTSSTTYKTTFNRRTGAGTARANVNDNPANIMLLEVSA